MSLRYCNCGNGIYPGGSCRSCLTPYEMLAVTRSNAGQLGVDITSGDLTVGLGNGLAIDTRTGELELEIAPGIDIDLGF